MTKLQIAAVAAALGLGVLAQIPEHNHDAMDGHNHTLPGNSDRLQHSTVSPNPEGLQTALFNVTGMT